MYILGQHLVSVTRSLWPVLILLVSPEQSISRLSPLNYFLLLNDLIM